VKILWAPNPLRTIVELEDPDRKVLREAIATSYDCADAAELNDLCGDYEQALREIHEGDCTCVACGCSKCGAEALLGINTITGLTKHLACQTNAAFGKSEEPSCNRTAEGLADRSLNEAIEELANYNPRPRWDTKRALWESCLPSWRDDARRAHAWLTAYRDRHFPEMRNCRAKEDTHG
jgi:hypothetical protein